MKRIVFLCNYSTSEVRAELPIRRYRIINAFRRLLHLPELGYRNSDIWYQDYIDELRKYVDKYEFHVVSSHQGLKRTFYDVEDNGIQFHYFNANNHYFVNVVKNWLNLDEKHDYRTNRQRFVSICKRLQPDLILLCGAENTYYSYGVLDVHNTPIMVILQTFLNDPKRIKMGVGSDYRRRKEMEIFKHANYFVTTNDAASLCIHQINPKAEVFPIRFVSHRPDIYPDISKDTDFVFFAGRIGVNKGLSDVIKALRLVVNTNPDACLKIIGGFSSETYRQEIVELISNLDLQRNVSIVGEYPDIWDVYHAVQKAKIVVIPGITALNSTVRESMLMGMPTIIYDIKGRKEMIPDDCIFAVPTGNTEELGRTMLDAYEHPEATSALALRGKIFAEQAFSNTKIGEQLVAAIDKILNQ